MHDIRFHNIVVEHLLAGDGGITRLDREEPSCGDLSSPSDHLFRLDRDIGRDERVDFIHQGINIASGDKVSGSLEVALVSLVGRRVGTNCGQWLRVADFGCSGRALV